MQSNICHEDIFNIYGLGVCHKYQVGQHGAGPKESTYKFKNTSPCGSLGGGGTEFAGKGMMGNSVRLSKYDSLIFGAPYDWTKTKSGDANQRLVGSVAKFSKSDSELACIPKPVPDDELGPHWGFGAKGNPDETKPIRHDLAGTAFVKGIIEKIVLPIYILMHIRWKNVKH